MPKLVLPRFTFLNGPPGSGKSTLATLICNADHSVWRDSFAEPIRQMLYSVFYPEEGPIAYSIDFQNSEVKARHFPWSLSNATFRDVMISFSEDWMKLKFGPDVFGRLAFRRCVEQEMYYDKFIFDDTGFAKEATHIVNLVGAANCRLIRLHRPDCSFAGDSRGYITLPGVPTLDLDNSGPPHDMLAALEMETL